MFKVCAPAARRARRFARRQSRFEMLEDRLALSGAPPTVTNVEVLSTDWDASYISYLQAHGLGLEGYAIPVGTTAQTATLSWNNLDQIKIKFSKDIDIQAADMSLSGKNTTSYAIAAFFYDPQTCVATWTLAAPLSKDRLMIDLDANGINPVKDLNGNVLDGDWTNNTSTYQSGNGSAGGDFEFLFNVLPGDVNSSGQVTNLDYVVARAQEGKNTTNSGYNAKCDVDGSGLVETSDWQFVLAKMADTLPTGSPAGASNDAPTTKGFAPVSISDAAIDVAISLWDAFADAENGASGLTYAVTSNSASSLFDQVSINPTTGALTLSAATETSGRAKLTLSATDSGGTTTTTSLNVDIDYVNQPPHIVYPVAQYLGAHTWKISGTVTDDQDVTDLIVEFHNVFETRAAVYPDGTFEFAVILESDPYGWEDAITHDRSGWESNTVSFVIGFS